MSIENTSDRGEYLVQKMGPSTPIERRSSFPPEERARVVNVIHTLQTYIRPETDGELSYFSQCIINRYRKFAARLLLFNYSVNELPLDAAFPAVIFDCFIDDILPRFAEEHPTLVPTAVTMFEKAGAAGIAVLVNLTGNDLDVAVHNVDPDTKKRSYEPLDSKYFDHYMVRTSKLGEPWQAKERESTTQESFKSQSHGGRKQSFYIHCLAKRVEGPFRKEKKGKVSLREEDFIESFQLSVEDAAEALMELDPDDNLENFMMFMCDDKRVKGPFSLAIEQTEYMDMRNRVVVKMTELSRQRSS